MVLPEIKSTDEDNTWTYEFVTVDMDDRMATSQCVVVQRRLKEL